MKRFFISRYGVIVVMVLAWVSSVHARFYENFLRETPHKDLKVLMDNFLAHAREFAKPPVDKLEHGQTVLERATNKPHAFIAQAEFENVLAAFIDRQKRELGNRALWLRGDVPAACHVLAPPVATTIESTALHVLGETSLMDPFVQKDLTVETQKGYFIGDLHGSLHTLLRIQSYLHIRGGIFASFTLRPGCFLVFTGDYIDRGHYGIEVLYLVLRLKLANWDRVFLIKGNHEDQKIKKEKGFGLELVTNYGDEAATVIINQYVKKVFSYFPYALFLGCGVGGERAFVQCCHGGIEVGYNPDPLLTTEDAVYEKLVVDGVYRDQQKAALTDVSGLAEPDLGNAGRFLNESVKDGFVSAVFSQDNGPAASGKMVWNKDEESFMADMATVDAYLLRHPLIKAIMRGHQDKEFGLKMFFTQANWRALPPARKEKLKNGPFNWREVIAPDDQADVSGFKLSHYAPVFTISSATEGKEVPFDGYCSITFGRAFDDWKMRFFEVPLSPARHGKYITIGFDTVMRIKTHGEEPTVGIFTRPVSPSPARGLLQPIPLTSMPTLVD